MISRLEVPPAELEAEPETELDLIERVRNATSDASWIVGECASIWCRRYANGRTDADFGELVNMGGESIAQRRRVFETFADVRDSYTCLKFSHYREATSWDDAAECLAWANENRATVAEMKAWRRMQHGEDLTVDAFDGLPEELETDLPVPVRTEQPQPAATSAAITTDLEPPAMRVDEAERLDEPGEYRPFRGDAMKPEQAEQAAENEPQQAAGLSPEQAIGRVTAAVERSVRLLQYLDAEQFDALPEKRRRRMQIAAGSLNDELARLEK